MILNQYSKQCSQTDEINTIVSICNQQQHQQQIVQQRHVLNRSFTIDTSSTTTAHDEHHHHNNRHAVLIQSNGPRSDSSRDSGTSSPQPNEIKLLNGNTKLSIHVQHTDIGSGTSGTTNGGNDDDDDDDSDSNDSVFSTSSSLDEDSIPLAYDEHKQYEARDIYLGGSCMLRTTWRRDIAIPYLRDKQITFHLPTLHENLSLKQFRKLKNETKAKTDEFTIEEVNDVTDGSSLMYNPRILDSSRVLLFVITNDTRSLAPMTLAAHYIGMGYNVVLCIQMLPDNCAIGNDKVSCCLLLLVVALHFDSNLSFLKQLTPSAIKDYNRGRTYLTDLAKRHNIPVLNEIKEALDCAIDKVKICMPRCSV